jgi:hypothetical protein
MSEKIQVRVQERLPEPTEAHEKLLPAANNAEHLKASQEQEQERLAEARQTIQETAPETTQNPLEQLKATDETNEPTQTSRSSIGQDLREVALTRELNNIRRKETAPQRTLSHVIHQPIVAKLSSIAAQSVSRPSGLLGGAIVALIGTSTYYYLAAHIGMRYNYSVFLALFVGGFIVGLIAEVMVRLVIRRRAE